MHTGLGQRDADDSKGLGKVRGAGLGHEARDATHRTRPDAEYSTETQHAVTRAFEKDALATRLAGFGRFAKLDDVRE